MDYSNTALNTKLDSNVDSSIKSGLDSTEKLGILKVEQGTKAALKEVAYNSYNDAGVVSSLQKTFCDNFNGSSLDTTSKWDLVQTGAGMTVTVNNGLTIAAGTTTNSETILLSKDSFTVSHRTMIDITPSQKIANQECHLELVSVDATGAVEAAGSLDFASWVWENVIGSGATNAIYKVQSGGTNLSTSASTALGLTLTSGGILELNATPDEVWFYAKAKNTAAARLGSFVHQQRVLDPSKRYKLRIRVKNLSSAPASNTNFVFGKVSVTDYTEMPIEITGGVGANSAGEAMPVNVVTVPSSMPVAGMAADNATASGNPLLMAGKALTSITAAATGQVKTLLQTLYGALVNKPYSIPEYDFQYSGTLTTTTAAAIKAAGAAGIRNYLTALQYQNTNATASTVIILDGASAIATFNAPASMAQPAIITFPTPLKGTAATALNINCGTTGASILANAQGYQAP